MGEVGIKNGGLGGRIRGNGDGKNAVKEDDF